MGQQSSRVNWRQSPAHLLFLSTFLKPRRLEQNPVDVDWRLNLGEPPDQVLTRLVRDGALRHLTMHEQLEFGLTVKQLQALLRERGLPVAGNKSELTSRLIQADWVAAGQAALEIADVFQCSDYGRQLAESYLADPEGTLGPPPAMTQENLAKLLRWLAAQAAPAVALGVVANFVTDWLRRLGEDLPSLASSETTVQIALGLALEFCYVPAGYFLMGSAGSDPDAYDREKPQHHLYLPAFYVGKYPITNEQYRVFVRATGQRAPDHWEYGRIPFGKEQHPVVNVYWAEAVAFCEWAARLSGRSLRLLTEAEWEKAARGTDGRRYPWGNDWRPGFSNSAHSVGDTTPVGSYPRGVAPHGSLDMIGNVWEWTSSAYQDYPYRADDGRERMSTDDWHVPRGGAYYSDARWSRAASRRHDHHYWSNDGFRVGWSAPFSPTSDR
jgi:formylglycine-generating enzyme required for sulfatase activity